MVKHSFIMRSVRGKRRKVNKEKYQRRCAFMNIICEEIIVHAMKNK